MRAGRRHPINRAGGGEPRHGHHAAQNRHLSSTTDRTATPPQPGVTARPLGKDLLPGNSTFTGERPEAKLSVSRAHTGSRSQGVHSLAGRCERTLQARGLPGGRGLERGHIPWRLGLQVFPEPLLRPREQAVRCRGHSALRPQPACVPTAGETRFGDSGSRVEPFPSSRPESAVAGRGVQDTMFGRTEGCLHAPPRSARDGGFSAESFEAMDTFPTIFGRLARSFAQARLLSLLPWLWRSRAELSTFLRGTCLAFSRVCEPTKVPVTSPGEPAEKHRFPGPVPGEAD